MSVGYGRSNVPRIVGSVLYAQGFVVHGSRLADGRLDLPSNVHGAPMTYLAGGRQYIVMAIGGVSRDAELLALTLERDEAMDGER